MLSELDTICYENMEQPREAASHNCSRSDTACAYISESVLRFLQRLHAPHGYKRFEIACYVK